MLNEKNIQKCFGSFLFNILTLFSFFDMGRLNNKRETVTCGAGVKNVILRLVYILNDFYAKSFDKELKPVIPCPLKCLAYNNIALLHGSEIPYDIARFHDK